jgi:hypothetical protein
LQLFKSVTQVRVSFADLNNCAVRGDAKPIADVYAENGVWLTRRGRARGSTAAAGPLLSQGRARVPAPPGARVGNLPDAPHVHDLPGVLPDPLRPPARDPEDADSWGEDHLPDAAPVFADQPRRRPSVPVFNDPQPGVLEQAGIEVLEPSGNFGRRPSPVDDLFRNEDREIAGARATQAAPWS